MKTMKTTTEDFVMSTSISPHYTTVINTENSEERNDVSALHKQRQGGSFCGCCCDMRRAVIVINILMILWEIFGSVLVEIRLEQMKGTIDFDFDDNDNSLIDQEKEDITKLEVTGVVILAVRMIGCGFAIYGAIAFKVWPIIPNICLQVLLVWATISSFMQGMSNVAIIAFDIITNGFFFYPHIMFLHYLRNGIMSPETYHQEAHSCCCLTQAEIDAKNAAIQHINDNYISEEV